MPRCLGGIEFTGQALPDAKLVTYALQVKRVIEHRLIMVISNDTVMVDGKVIYVAKDLRVGLFQIDQKVS